MKKKEKRKEKDSKKEGERIPNRKSQNILYCDAN